MMRNFLLLTVSVVMLASVPPQARAQNVGTNQPFVGIWKLNVEKSHMRARPGNFITYRQFADHGDGWMFHTVINIGPRGTDFLFTAARYDGKQYADYNTETLGNLVVLGETPSRTVAFTRVTANEINWTDRVNGKIVASGAETVSADGLSLTITNQQPGRKEVFAQVFDRQT